MSENHTAAGRQKERGGEEQAQRKKERKKGTKKYITHFCPPVTPTLPPTLPLPLSSNGSEALAGDRGGERKRITCQYLFPLAAQIETDTLHSLSLSL